MKPLILSPLVLRWRNQAGLTLVELMISITLGLMVTLAATALLVSSKSTYLSQDDGIQLQDGARFALESINRSVRQAGYENWDKNELGAPIIATPDMGPSIQGLDAQSLSDGTSGISGKTSTGVINGSDVLAVRFLGVNDPITPTNPEGSIVDCAGNGVSAPTSQSTANVDRGWSIYYVALNATTGEPELNCRYLDNSSATWKSVAVASGVESFQVLYGVDTDGAASSPVVAGDRIANQFLTATQINALDDARPAIPTPTNANTYWKRVTAIKVALLMRGTQNRQADIVATKYDLFGEQYSTANAATDTGTKITVSNISTAVRKRTRKIYVSTIQLRNQNEGSGS